MNTIAPGTLVDTLTGWRKQMSAEVRLVFDHDDAYDRILAMADELAAGPTDLAATAADQAARAQRLAELSERLDEMGNRVSEWNGASRQAFDQTVELLNSRVHALAEVGQQSSELLDTAVRGRQAVDQLFADMVHTSIDYAERSLQVARTMAPLTAGASMSQWTISNLRQVDRLLDQLADAGRQVSALVDQVSFLVVDLTSTTRELSEDLSRLAGGLSS